MEIFSKRETLAGFFFTQLSSSWLLPDCAFHNFRAWKCIDWQIACSLEISTDKFWSFETVKCLVWSLWLDAWAQNLLRNSWRDYLWRLFRDISKTRLICSTSPAYPTRFPVDKRASKVDPMSAADVMMGIPVLHTINEIKHFELSQFSVVVSVEYCCRASKTY